VLRCACRVSVGPLRWQRPDGARPADPPRTAHAGHPAEGAKTFAPLACLYPRVPRAFIHRTGRGRGETHPRSRPVQVAELERRRWYRGV